MVGVNYLIMALFFSVDDGRQVQATLNSAVAMPSSLGRMICQPGFVETLGIF